MHPPDSYRLLPGSTPGFWGSRLDRARLLSACQLCSKPADAGAAPPAPLAAADPNAPKRPLSAYMFFASDKRKEVSRRSGRARAGTPSTTRLLLQTAIMAPCFQAPARPGAAVALVGCLFRAAASSLEINEAHCPDTLS